MSGSYALDYKPDSGVWKVGLDLDQAATANDNLYTLAYNQIPQIASVTTTKAAFDWNGYSDVNRPYAANGLNQYTQSGAKTLGYDGNGNLAGDRRYRYSGVPLDVARGFGAAPSKGGYYNRWIRGHFPCRELGAQQRRRQLG